MIHRAILLHGSRKESVLIESCNQNIARLITKQHDPIVYVLPDLGSIALTLYKAESRQWLDQTIEQAKNTTNKRDLVSISKVLLALWQLQTKLDKARLDQESCFDNQKYMDLDIRPDPINRAMLASQALSIVNVRPWIYIQPYKTQYAT